MRNRNKRNKPGGPSRLALPGVNDVPLRFKFLLIYVLCVLIPIMAINLFFFREISSSIEIREEENLRKSIERAAGELQAMIEESVALSHTLRGDRELTEAMDRSYDSPYAFFDVYDSLLRDRLKRYTSAYPNLLDVGVYTNNGTIQTGNHYFVVDERDTPYDWYVRMKEADGNFLVVGFMESGLVNPGKRISVISKLNAFDELAAYDKLLRIDLNVDKIYRILSRERDNVKLRLVDDRGRVVADGADAARQNMPFAPLPAAPADGPRHAELSLGDAEYIRGWRLVGEPDTARIDGLLAGARRSIAWLAVISTVIPSLLIYIILRSYHYRVKKLARHMEKIRHERFELIELSEGRDEIGRLIATYNMMADKINSLINDVYKLEIRQKNLELERMRAELNMLHSQMNPHFLFNTLNALLVVCTKNGYGDVTAIIKNLSLLMRRLLSWTDDLVPLEEELQFTAMYLDIEKFRFGSRFDYVFDIDPRTRAYRVPKMSVQPLVENACKHGLQAKKGDRRIVVSARLSEPGLAIAVADNGVGMDEAQRRRLLEAVRSDGEPDGHVGIRNVCRRLELFYKDSVRFRLDSGPGEGTEAGFCIPHQRLIEGGGEEDGDVRRAAGG